MLKSALLPVSLVLVLAACQSSGSAGAPGAPGLAGAAGAGGEYGSPGSAGPTGVSGAAGAMGATGAAAGPGGATGLAGAAGSIGPTGAAGATAGATGSTGATGNVGPTGIAGTTGSAGAGGATGPALYARTVLVSPVGTAQQNGTALLAAMAGITTASATNPWLLNIEPGVYDVGTTSLALQSYVDIEGSGEDTTTITGTSPASGTYRGTVTAASVAGVELRSLTVTAAAAASSFHGWSHEMPDSECIRRSCR